VIATANALFGDQTVFQRNAAMTAVKMQQSDTTRAVSKKDQILAQDPDANRQILQLV
jgi:hypothetical protein